MIVMGKSDWEGQLLSAKLQDWITVWDTYQMKLDIIESLTLT